jgi:hypothetical protein
LAAREGVAQYDSGYTEVKRQADSASPYTQSSPQYHADQRLLGNDPTSSPTMTRGSIRPNDGPDKRRRLEPIDTIKLVSNYFAVASRFEQGLLPCSLTSKPLNLFCNGLAGLEISVIGTQAIRRRKNMAEDVQVQIVENIARDSEYTRFLVSNDTGSEYTQIS